MKGRLDTRQAVRSPLKLKLVDHFNSIHLKTFQNKLISHSDKISYLDYLLLGKDLNQHKDRKTIETNIKNQIWNQESVATIGQKIYKVQMNNSKNTRTSNWLNCNSIQLKSRNTSCDIDSLAKDFQPEELKVLAEKQMHYKFIENPFQAFFGGVLAFLSTFAGDTSVPSKVLWKFASEENEYRIRVNTPMMLIGDFTFKNGNMKADKVHFFGKNLFGLIDNLEESLFRWRFFLVLSGLVLGAFALQKILVSRVERVKAQLKKEQIKMEQMLEKQSETVDDNYKCVICYTYIRNVIFHPCKHIVCCLFCVKSMRESNARISNKCPMCKVVINKTVKIGYM